MKRSFVLLALAVMMFGLFMTAQAEKEVTLSGRIYAHWYMDLSDSLNNSMSNKNFDSYNTFGVSRTYLTGAGKLSDKTSGKITIDINPADNNIRLKYAFLKWNFYQAQQYDLAAVFGLQGTPWNGGMEKIWGRRYISKVPADQLGMETTSDYGISLNSGLGEKGKWGNATLALFNGTTYSSPVDNNGSKDINLAAFIKPLNSNADFGKSTVGFQYYMGTLNSYDDSSQTKDDYKKTIMSFAANVQYRHTGAVGVEYNSYKSSVNLQNGNFWMQNGNVVENKANALAIFGTLWFEDLAANSRMLKTLDLFFRYMTFDPDADDINNDMKTNELIVGVECAPIKGFASSLNYRTEKTTVTGSDDISNAYLFFNTIIDF